MGVKKITLPVEYVTQKSGNISVAKICTPDLDGNRISLHITQVGENSVFLERPEEGHLVVQEFLTDESKKIYFEVDSRGHLLLILPNDNFDAEIDSNGHLLLKETVGTDFNEDFNDDFG